MSNEVEETNSLKLVTPGHASSETEGRSVDAGPGDADCSPDGRVPYMMSQIQETLQTLDTAVDTILGKVEELHSKYEREGLAENPVLDACREITFACCFHDLCSQRLNIVLKSLEEFGDELTDGSNGTREEASILASVGESETRSATQDVQGGGSLLNGPAMTGEGLSQEDVDELLKSFEEFN